MGKFKVGDEWTREQARKGAKVTMSKYGRAHLLKIVSQYRRSQPLTNIEQAVADMLDAMGVEYSTNAVVETVAVVDFLIGPHAVIECDGAYWHNERQAVDSVRDLKLRMSGYYVLRLSEQLILKSPDECIALIAQFLLDRDQG